MATKSKKTSARRSTTTVKKRGWSLSKFQEVVVAAAKRREIPKTKVKPSVVEKAYNDGKTVRATVDAIAA